MQKPQEKYLQLLKRHQNLRKQFLNNNRWVRTFITSRNHSLLSANNSNFGSAKDMDILDLSNEPSTPNLQKNSSTTIELLSTTNNEYWNWLD